jgi:hypothetical protein
MRRIHWLVVLPFVLAFASATRADEGLWLFNNVPAKLLKEKYSFDPPNLDKWLEHIQESCVRFPGGSGSFVSPDGLVMTNHHVGSGFIQRLSSKEADYLKNGFQAKTRADEKMCKGLELYCLQKIDDVTQRVKAAVKPGMKPEEAADARKAVITQIESESEKKTGLQPEVVTLYNGGQYHLYLYKKYSDVRLVFAPEQQIAFFGGDPDNFEYPRFDYDVTFFRVYENGKPLKVDHYLKWSKNGAKDGELVFLAGHPGKTDRLNTVAELDYLSSKGVPYVLERLYRREVLLSLYSSRDAENARKAKDLLFGAQNSRKHFDGELAGMLDPALIARKQAYEKKLRDAVAKNPELRDVAKAWDEIAKIQKTRAALIRDYTLLEAGHGFWSLPFNYARSLVRAADELAKPNEKRLQGYTDSDLPSLKVALFAQRPIYDDLEQLKLADALTWMAEQLGPNHAVVTKVLQGKSPRHRAAELVNGTKLDKVATRKELFEGGKKAVDASKDTMIELARLIDKEARDVRKKMEQVEEVRKQAYDLIAKAKFAVEGTSTYPDATFTLRLAFGPIKSYEENGKTVAPFTDFAGMYKRAHDQGYRPPFDLPERWLKNKDKLKLSTPYNFVFAGDSIGGNSGSPVFNRAGELVGILFDGNIHSLVWGFIYDDTQARSVAVDSRGIIEGLRAIYGAGELADEIVGGKR